jgi:signal transduction histidine kinase
MWWIRPIGLSAVVALVSIARPHPGLSGRGLLILLALIVTAAGWAWEFGTERRGGGSSIPALLIAGIAGALLTVADPTGTSIVYPLVAAGACGALLATPMAIYAVAAIAVTLVAGFASSGTAHVDNLVWIIPLLGFVALAGSVRRGYVQRAEQAELLLAQAQRTREAEAGAAALAERARIARDLHDVLAHSIAALAMQLEAADALLTSGDIPRAHQTVLRARGLARDGLVETRRAVSALREDYRPLPYELQALADAHGTPVRLEVVGTERELPADARDAVFRAAQEAVTNAGKHAPGSALTMRLEFEPSAVLLEVHNAAAQAAAPLADTGAGLGLVGMRERAAALGGSAEAGPAGDGWTVRVTIPA